MVRALLPLLGPLVFFTAMPATALRRLHALLLLLLPVALAAPLDAADWLQFPGGRLVHSSCVHRHATASPGPLPPCQHPHPPAPPSSRAAYYGGWSVYAYLPANRSLAHMSATFTVPPKPTSLGPLGLSSLYMCAARACSAARAADPSRRQISWAGGRQPHVHTAACAAGDLQHPPTPTPSSSPSSLPRLTLTHGSKRGCNLSRRFLR